MTLESQFGLFLTLVDLLASGKLSAGKWVGLHAFGAVDLVHAILLRFRVLLLPIQLLVFGGH